MRSEKYETKVVAERVERVAERLRIFDALVAQVDDARILSELKIARKRLVSVQKTKAKDEKRQAWFTRAGKALNDRSREHAHVGGSKWDKDEDALVMSGEETDEDLAKKLGRSYTAVVTRRYILRKRSIKS